MLMVCLKKMRTHQEVIVGVITLTRSFTLTQNKKVFLKE